MEPDATIQAQTDPLIGQTIDEKYLIREKIGGGGMGAVYKAEHTLMRRTVAIKILRPDLSTANEDELLKRFEKEARLASRLSHPNAITIYDFGRDQGRLYLVMEYLQGESLKSVLTRSGALGVPRTLEFLRQIAAGLSEAHAMGIVHRDLKPDNVMIVKTRDNNERVIVLDFGIAKLTQMDDEPKSDLTETGKIIGTPKYMSPEQIQGGELDARSDIYCLGLLVYEMLTGAAPYEAASAVDQLLKHVSGTPRPFSVVAPKAAPPKAIEQLVLKALAKAPGDRFPTVEQFYSQFARAAKDLPGIVTSSDGQFRNDTRSSEALSSDTKTVRGGTTKENFLRQKAPLLVLVAAVVGLGFTLIALLRGSNEDDVARIADEQLLAKLEQQAPPSVPVTAPTVPVVTQELPQALPVSPPSELPEVPIVPPPPPPVEVKVTPPTSPPGEARDVVPSPRPKEGPPPKRQAALQPVLDKAAQLASQGKYQEAAGYLRQEQAKFPNNYQLKLALGSYIAYAGDFKESRAILMELIRAYPKRADAPYNLACLYALNGYKAKALTYLQNAISLEPRFRGIAARDADFNSLRGDPAFNSLIGRTR